MTVNGTSRMTRNAPSTVQLPPNMYKPMGLSLTKNRRQSCQRRRMLLRLRPLLNNFCRNSHTRRPQFLPSWRPACARLLRYNSQASSPQIALSTLSYVTKNKAAPGAGPYYSRSNAIVDTSKAAGGQEAGRGLKASLKGVERVERCVDCCACCFRLPRYVSG